MDRYTDMQEGREGGRGREEGREQGRETMRRSTVLLHVQLRYSHGGCVSPKALSENYTWKICV